MAERPHYFGNWCILFTDAVCLAGVYCLVGTAGADTLVALSLPIWLAWMSIAYPLLALFLRRPRTTGQLAVVISLLYGAGAALVLPHSSLAGISSILFGLVFLLVTPLRAAFLLLEPFKARTPMSYVELSVSAALLFQFLHLGVASFPDLYSFLILVAVLLCFFYLIAIRLFPNGVTAVLFSRRHAIAALAACVLLIGAFFVVTHLAYGPVQQGILQAWEAIKAAAGAAAGAISAGLTYLLSLLPEVEVEGGEPPPPQSASSSEESLLEETSSMLPPWLMPAAILGMIVVVLLIVVLLLRGKRHGGVHAQTASAASRVQRSRPSWWRQLAARLRQLSRHLRFRMLAWRYRRTPQGILVGLERWARAAGIPRAPGQTARAFLHQLSQHPAFAQDGALLEELAQTLDRCYFEMPSAPLHPAQKELFQLLHRSAKGIPTEKRA